MRAICYLGPSLDLATAKDVAPDVEFFPPARHFDIASDLYQINPTHILLIDGTFSQDLPVWNKEITLALLKGVRVYGSSSMGALRAAELSEYGMIGVGKIYKWYYEGVTDDDSEVAVSYHKTPNGNFVCDTCPLVNVRAGLLKLLEDGIFDQDEAEKAFYQEQHIHYSRRSQPEYALDQKRIDAIELLSTFKDLESSSYSLPDISHLTPLFSGAFERERRIEFKNSILTMQNVDSYISLHSPDHHQIRWDAQNRRLVLILADIMGVTVSPEEIESEWTCFCARSNLLTIESLNSWLESNLMSHEEFHVLTIQNAKIRKMQKALITTNMFSRQTRTILDYLRSHDRLSLFVEDCADIERKIIDENNAEIVEVELTTGLNQLLEDHCDATGLTITGTLEDFIRDTGIGTLDELRVCLERYSLARKSK